MFCTFGRLWNDDSCYQLGPRLLLFLNLCSACCFVVVIRFLLYAELWAGRLCIDTTSSSLWQHDAEEVNVNARRCWLRVPMLKLDIEIFFFQYIFDIDFEMFRIHSKTYKFEMFTIHNSGFDSRSQINFHSANKYIHSHAHDVCWQRFVISWMFFSLVFKLFGLSTPWAMVPWCLIYRFL